MVEFLSKLNISEYMFPKIGPAIFQRTLGERRKALFFVLDIPVTENFGSELLLTRP
jgi:hypothetical protein